jgi:hypothetical protein
MVWLREIWAAIRETVFVAAQVVTLGVLALVLGLIALNVLTQGPPSRPTSVGSQPSRPLAALVPTLVPDTPTPASTPSPAPATATAPPATPTARPVDAAPPAPSGAASATPAAEGQASPAAAAPTAAASGQPPPAAAPAPPTATPRPAPAPPATAGQPMKVLPAPDGLPARVRAEPSTRAPILVRVPLGATVEVLGAANGDELQPGNAKWLKVKWRGTTGYVYSTLVGEP